MSPTTACFEAQYALVYAYPVSPAFDATKTKRPHPRLDHLGEERAGEAERGGRVDGHDALPGLVVGRRRARRSR